MQLTAVCAWRVEPAEGLICTSPSAGPLSHFLDCLPAGSARPGPGRSPAPEACGVRNATLTAALADLVASGRVHKGASGYVIRSDFRFPCTR